MDPHSLTGPDAAARAPKARFRSLGRKNALVERVVDAIESEIFAGRLLVGAKLPPERELSERLGVSRTVVREAVRILVTKGLLETRHGLGTTVRAVTRQEFIEPLTLFLRNGGEKVSLEHLYQVRSILEVESAGRAAENATEADIDELRRICSEMELAAGDPQRFAKKDAEFHSRLGQATRNPLIPLLLDSISDLMTEVRNLVAHQQGLFERVMPTHLLILRCVSKKDAKGARKAMGEHVATAFAIQKELAHYGSFDDLLSVRKRTASGGHMRSSVSSSSDD